MKISYLFIGILMLSCKGLPADNQRDAFMGWKLGSTLNQASAHNRQLLEMGTAHPIDGYDQYYYIEFKTFEGNKYYAIPSFHGMPADTIISSIDICYFDVLNSATSVVSTIQKGDFSMHYPNRMFNPRDFLTTLTSELEKKYGQFTRSDTDLSSGTYNFYWKNKNDVDIKFKFRFDQSPQFYGYWGANLNYQYTPEMLHAVSTTSVY